ncbi:hypothetical protein ACFLWC_04480 [Chloroflexota bacterium]
MWRRKKFIVIALLATVVLAGSIGGVALAQTENEDDSQPKTLLARVAEILDIDQQKLEDAFAQAQSEMRDEALDSYLQNLVKEGNITQEEADQYKAWCQARPDMEPFQQHLREWQQARPGMPPELEEWQEARPDMPLPGSFGRFGGRGFQDGMKWGGGHHFWGR